MDLFQRLFTNEVYVGALLNTLLFVGIAIPLKITAALFLSGFLTTWKRFRSVRVLNVLYLLPWALPTVAAALSFRWTLNYDYGLMNKLLTDVGLPKVMWLLRYSSAMAAVIMFHIWKWLPMWTLTFLAGRQAIPEEIYESAQIDGASLRQRFRHITLPLLLKLWLMCLTLSSISSIGEFEAIWLVTMAGPAQSTHIVTTLGFRYAFTDANLPLAMVAYITVFPAVIILVAFLMKLARGGET